MRTNCAELSAELHLDRHLLEGEPELLGDEGRAGHHRDVLEVAAAAVAEAGRLDRRDVEHLGSDGGGGAGGRGAVATGVIVY